MRILTLARALSLDVALGSLGSAAFVAALLGVHLTPHVLLLPVGVWLIYTLDHLLDARRISQPASQFRHRFHQEHFGSIAAVWMMVAIGAGLWVWFGAPERLLRMGFLVLGLCLLHLMLVWLVGNRTGVLLQKELAVAGIYTLGVSVAPLSLHHSFEGYWLPALLLLLSAIVNLLTLSWFELQSDKAEGQSSWVQGLGTGRSQLIIWGLTLLGMMVALLALVLEWGIASPLRQWALSLALGQAVWQWMPIAMPYIFQPFGRYRTWGDAGFLLYLLLLVL